MEVEAVIADDPRWHIVARCVGSAPDSLALADPTWNRLGDAPVAEYAEQPAARDRAGRPRVDIYAFRLVRPEDQALFAPGQLVSLYRDPSIHRPAI